MPTFKSDISNRSFQTQPMREFEVPDGSALLPTQTQSFTTAIPTDLYGTPVSNLADIEREVAEAKRAKMTGKEKLGDTARKRIEILTGLGRLEREVEIEGVKFGLHSLKGRELREIFSAIAPYDGTVELSFELRKQTLARALHRVFDTDLDLYLGNNTLEARLEIVEEMDEAVLSRLQAEYQLMVDEINQKYAIKTSEDAKTLADDLKK